MANRYAEIAFTTGVKRTQRELGSRDFYEKFELGNPTNVFLTTKEKSFLSHRDSFYLATVNELGWPYLQHRGGPPGFVHVIDDNHIGFSDFRGNRQFLSTSNVRHDDRVSLFFMDYAERRRLKMFGHMRQLGEHEHTVIECLSVGDYRAKVERAFIIEIVAFDWNCPQHITPRFSIEEIKRSRGKLV